MNPGEKLAAKIAKQIEKRGNTLTARIESGGDTCPCREPRTGYSNPQYHRDNPTAPICNEAGLINAVVEDITFKGFVLPVDEEHERKFSALGAIQKDDQTLFYSGGVNLEGATFVQYAGRHYDVRNGDEYRIADTVVVRVGLMRLRNA